MCHHHPPPTPKLLIVKEHSGKKVLIVKEAQNDPLLTHPAPQKMTRWTEFRNYNVMGSLRSVTSNTESRGGVPSPSLIVRLTLGTGQS